MTGTDAIGTSGGGFNVDERVVEAGLQTRLAKGIVNP